MQQVPDIWGSLSQQRPCLLELLPYDLPGPESALPPGRTHPEALPGSPPGPTGPELGRLISQWFWITGGILGHGFKAQT